MAGKRESALYCVQNGPPAGMNGPGVNLFRGSLIKNALENTGVRQCRCDSPWHFAGQLHGKSSLTNRPADESVTVRHSHSKLAGHPEAQRLVRDYGCRGTVSELAQAVKNALDQTKK